MNSVLRPSNRRRDPIGLFELIPINGQHNLTVVQVRDANMAFGVITNRFGTAELRGAAGVAITAILDFLGRVAVTVFNPKTIDPATQFCKNVKWFHNRWH